MICPGQAYLPTLLESIIKHLNKGEQRLPLTKRRRTPTPAGDPSPFPSSLLPSSSFLLLLLGRPPQERSPSSSNWPTTRRRGGYCSRRYCSSGCYCSAPCYSTNPRVCPSFYWWPAPHGPKCCGPEAHSPSCPNYT